MDARNDFSKKIEDGFSNGLVIQNNDVVQILQGLVKLEEVLSRVWGFNQEQSQFLKSLCQKNMPMEQFEIVANPKYDRNQMTSIANGFLNGLTMEQVKFYANEKYNDSQMNEIRCGFENGLTMEQIKLYSDPKTDALLMGVLRCGIQNGMTSEQIKYVMGSGLDWAQIEELCYCFNNSFSQEQIDFLAQSKLDYKQMRILEQSFKCGLEIEDVKHHIYPKITTAELSTICNNLLEQMSEELEQDMGGIE